MYCLNVSTREAEKEIVELSEVLCTLEDRTKHDHRGLGVDLITYCPGDGCMISNILVRWIFG